MANPDLQSKVVESGIDKSSFNEGLAMDWDDDESSYGGAASVKSGISKSARSEASGATSAAGMSAMEARSVAATEMQTLNVGRKVCFHSRVY